MDYKLKQMFKAKVAELMDKYKLPVSDSNKLLAATRRLFIEQRDRDSSFLAGLVDSFQANMREQDPGFVQAHLEACTFAVRQALKVAKAREEATRTAELV